MLPFTQLTVSQLIHSLEAKILGSFSLSPAPPKNRLPFPLVCFRIMTKGSPPCFPILFSNYLFSVLCPLSLAESPKESSEPTGSPAPVIQHSSATAPSNGLSVRSAAEAVATSVLTQMASQRTELSMPIQSHVIMTPQSQSAGR